MNFLVEAVRRGLLTPMEAAAAQGEQRAEEAIAETLVRLGRLRPDQVEALEAERSGGFVRSERALPDDLLADMLGQAAAPEGWEEEVTVLDSRSPGGALMEGLLPLAGALGAEFRLEAGLDRGLRVLLDLFPAAGRGAVYLASDEGDDRWRAEPLVAVVRPPDPAPGPIPSSVVGPALDSGCAIEGRAVEAGPEGVGRIFLAAPLRAGDGPPGVLLLDRVDPVGVVGFGPDDLAEFAAASTLVIGFVDRCRRAAGAALAELDSAVRSVFTFPPAPSVAGYRLALEPGSRGPGGDLLDVRSGPGSSLRVFVARVPGRSLRATVARAQLSTLFREMGGADLGQVLAAMDSVLALAGEKVLGAAAILAEVGQSGGVRLGGSGCPAPLVRTAGAWSCPALGSAEQIELALDSGDVLLLHAGGIRSDDAVNLLSGSAAGAEDLVDHFYRQASLEHGDRPAIAAIERE